MPTGSKTTKKKAAASKSTRPKAKTSEKPAVAKAPAKNKAPAKSKVTAAPKASKKKSLASSGGGRSGKPAAAPGKAAATTSKASGKSVSPVPTAKSKTAAGGPAQKAPKKSPSKETSKTEAKRPSPTTTSRVATPRRKLRYKQGQYVVYPLHGVGLINVIEERPFQDQTLLYYIIYIEVSDMTVMVPVDKADGLGIRPIVEKRASNKALKLISEDYEPVPTDWKLRYQMNLDLLKSGSVTDIAKVVRTLYHRSKVKELPILERKLFDSALRLLIDEVSLSLEKTKQEVEELVFQRLESSLE